MERKLIVLALTAIIVSVSIFWFVILPALPIDTTISQIVSNPEVWVNKRVRVKGTINELGLLRIPGFMNIPPYNYELEDKDNRTIRIGVLYSGEIQDTPANAIVIGVVEEGATIGIIDGERAGISWVHFIEAEKMVILESVLSETVSISGCGIKVVVHTSEKGGYEG